MWDLPRPGIKPVSPALQGRLLTTGPPGKPLNLRNNEQNIIALGFLIFLGDQIANTRWIMKKAREFQKNIYFCFIDYAKAFDSVDHNKLWKILKKMGIPDHLWY